MTVRIVGYVTRYYARHKGVLSRQEYFTKSLTPMHASIRERLGGMTLREEIDDGLFRQTGGFLGTGYETIAAAYDRYEALRKQARAEYWARRSAKRAARGAKAHA